MWSAYSFFKFCFHHFFFVVRLDQSVAKMVKHNWIRWHFWLVALVAQSVCDLVIFCNGFNSEISSILSANTWLLHVIYECWNRNKIRKSNQKEQEISFKLDVHVPYFIAAKKKNQIKSKLITELYGFIVKAVQLKTLMCCKRLSFCCFFFFLLNMSFRGSCTFTFDWESNHVWVIFSICLL